MENTESLVGGGISRTQMSGILYKQPFGPRNQSTKWTKRFFVLKDGYLLYYLEGEKKDFDKRQFIHLHPKGIVPLGGCSVETTKETGHPFTIKIKSPEIMTDFLLSAESDLVRSRWIDALNQSTRITWRNAQLGDALIAQLERHGLQLANEKQQYADRLQSETIESTSYKAKAEELSKQNEELAAENRKLEQLVDSMKKEYDDLSNKLEETLKAMKSVDETKRTIQHTFQKLESNLQELDSEKKTIADALHQQTLQSEKLTAERQDLVEETAKLSGRLGEVEARMAAIAAEKLAAEQSFKEQEAEALRLLEDKRSIEERAAQLEQSMQELTTQKSMTEAELEEEHQARLEVEKRLREAEESLARLESSLLANQDTTTTTPKNNYSDNHQMISDVKALRKFFENAAFEAKLDARKSIMVKTALMSRKYHHLRRPKTIRQQQSRQSMPSSDVLPEYSNTSSTALSSGSSTEEDIYQMSARVCLNTPGVRSTIIGMLQDLDRPNNFNQSLRREP